MDVQQAARQQTGADEQNDRERKFSDDEHSPDAARRGAARSTSRALIERGLQIPARCGDGRGESDQNSRQKRKRQRPAECPGIERRLRRDARALGPQRQDHANARQRDKQPANPETIASVTLSMSNCRTICPGWRPTPIGSRSHARARRFARATALRCWQPPSAARTTRRRSASIAPGASQNP